MCWRSDFRIASKDGAASDGLAHLARDTAFAFEHGSDDLPFRFKLWFGKAFDLARAIADFAASTLARKKRDLERQLEALLAARTCASRPRVAGRNRARARSASHLSRLSQRGGRHEQYVRAQPAHANPAKSHKRLSRNVGRPSRSRCANHHRHRLACRRKPLQRHRQHPGLSAAQTAKSALRCWGG